MRRVTVFDYEAGNLHSLLKALDDPALGLSIRVETDARALVKDTALLVLPGVGAFGHATARLAPGRAEVAAALRDGLPAVGICLGLQLLCEASDEGEGVGLGVVPGRVRRLQARRVPQIGWNEVEWVGGVGPGAEVSGANDPVIPSEGRSPESRDLRAHARGSFDSASLRDAPLRTTEGGALLRDAPLRTTEEGGAPHSSTSVIPSEGRSPESRDLRAHTALSIAYYANSYVAAIDPSDPCVLATSTHERDRFAAVVQVARTIGVQFHPEKSSADGVAFLRGIVAAAFGVAVAA